MEKFKDMTVGQIVADNIETADVLARFGIDFCCNGGYDAPEDACNSYRKVMKDLKEFNRALHEHIHLENNIVFPEAIALATELA